MQCKQPPWEVLGGCRLFVAGGDWNYILWSDVTCSPTPHHWNPQTVLTHAHAWLLSLRLYWLVRVIHFRHLSHQWRNSVTGSLQIPTGGWECPHIYRRQTWARMLLPGCCCLMNLWMTYFSRSYIWTWTWWNTNPRSFRIQLLDVCKWNNVMAKSAVLFKTH